MSGIGERAGAGSNRGKWVLLLGGSRSGKSAMGERVAREKGGRDVLFVATGQARDAEMRERIQRHQADRAKYGWRTLEAPDQIGAKVLAALTGDEKVVLFDCLTLLVSNAICALGEEASSSEAEAKAAAELDALLAVMRQCPADFVVVSNEVGLGLVSPYKLGRLFSDAMGRANQRMAAAADEVFFMAAGLSIKLK
ncbi:MAG: bifunctional adenosylcobinamide kinase/adenosylcobinamide-phosphate guanylyltransferase [Kiritimatiellia bacterium]